MEENSNLIRVYTGTEITVNLLKDELEKSGIHGIVRNDYNSGIIAGFSAGSSSAVDLLIFETDLEKAEPILSDFTRINKG